MKKKDSRKALFKLIKQLDIKEINVSRDEPEQIEICGVDHHRQSPFIYIRLTAVPK